MPRRPKHRPDSDGVEIKLVNRARSDIGAPLADQHRVAIRWRVDNAADIHISSARSLPQSRRRGGARRKAMLS